MIIITIGIILAIFLSLVLGSKKVKSLSDKILVAWLVTIAITLILFKLQTVEFRYDYPFFLGWSFPFPLLQWPFLYLYVNSLTAKKTFQLKLLLHFVPFFLSIALFSSYLFLPNASKLKIYEAQGSGYETQLTINLIAIIISAIIYTILSIIKLMQHRIRIKDEFSYVEKINLNWMFFLIVGMIIIFLVIAISGSDKPIFTSVSGFVVFIGYFGIKQVGIFTNQPNSSEISQTVVNQYDKKSFESKSNFITITGDENATISDSEIETTESKYQKSTLNEDSAREIHQDLKKLMQTEKVYKNEELSLDDLAKHLKVLPNHLSQVINSIENKNFYDYINQLRIEEFKELISNPENQKFTLLSLAFECGFNSKTSFNRNFKKVTGYTPSEYLKQENSNTKA